VAGYGDATGAGLEEEGYTVGQMLALATEAAGGRHRRVRAGRHRPHRSETGLPLWFIEADHCTEEVPITAAKYDTYMRHFHRKVKDTDGQDEPMWRTHWSAPEPQWGEGAVEAERQAEARGLAQDHLGKLSLSVAAARLEGMHSDDQHLLRGRIYEADHNHPGPKPGRSYAELVGGPLDGLLLDITGWRPEEIDDGASLLAETGAVRARRPGSVRPAPR
jgi:hypothetical protein